MTEHRATSTEERQAPPDAAPGGAPVRRPERAFPSRLAIGSAALVVLVAGLVVAAGWCRRRASRIEQGFVRAASGDGRRS